MQLVLLLTATAFLGGFEKQQDRISHLTTFNNSSNKGILNQWYGPVNSKDQSLFNYRTLDIDHYEIFPDYAGNESKQLDLSDEYTNSIIKALLELSDLPEPGDDETNEKYIRGPFYLPKYTHRFTIFRSKNQKYKTQIVEDGTMNASARKKRFREDDGRIVGGVSSLQFSYVNHKFSSTPPGRTKRMIAEDTRDEEEDFNPGSSKIGDKEMTKEEGLRILGGESSLQFANENHKFRNVLPLRMKRFAEDDVGDEEEDSKKGGANAKGKDKTTGGGGRIVGGTSSLQHANVNYKFRSALPGRVKRFAEDDVGDEEEDAKDDGSKTGGKDTTKGDGGRIVGGTSSLQHANVNYKFRSALPGRMKRSTEDDVGDEEEDAKKGGENSKGKDKTTGGGGRIVGGTSSLQHANVNYKFRSALPGRIKRSTDDDVGDEEEDAKKGGANSKGKDKTTGGGGRIVGGTSSLQHANVNYKFRSALPGRMKRSTEDDVGDEEEDAKKGGSKTGGKDTTKGDGGRIVGGTSSLQHANVKYKFRSGLPGRTKRFLNIGNGEVGSKTGGKNPTKGGVGRIIGGISSLIHSNVNQKFKSAFPG